MEQNFLRPIVPETFSPLTSDIIFQPIDWKSCDLKAEKLGEEDDEEEEEDYDEDDYEEDEDGGFKKKYSNKKNLVLRTYGVTEEGHSICVHIEGFQPYFYFKIPQDWEKPQFDYFVEKVKEKVDFFNRKGLIIGTIVNKKEFYGFTNNELFKFGVFTFRNQAAYRSYLKVFKEEKILLNKLGIELDLSASLYETKVDALLRFFHVQNLDPAGWCKLTAGKYILNRKNKKTRCQLDVTIHFQNIEKVDKSSISKIMIASYDIECVSEDGSFPKAERANDKIIQIGTSVNIFGEDECCFRYIAVLGDCLPIEGARVECFKTEKDLIIGWARFMAKLDPDVITGYNIWGFDWEFLYKRAEYGFEPNGRKSPYHKTLVKILQRIEKLETGKKEIDDNTFKLTEKQLSSSAMGDNFLKFIDIEGVVQIDLLKYFQREEKFDSYKLDNVAKEIIGQQKEDLKPHEIFENFRIGTPDKIREIATYCIQDCVLVNNLMNKKKVITNNLGMANVCVVPFSFIFLRGQGIKIFSLVVKFSREDNFLIKDLPSEKDESSYEGAIVFVPKPGIYFEPVVVMDYNSLYPSSMIAENISHDSILGYKEYRLKPGKSGENKEEDYELIADTIAYKYMDLPGYHYIDIEYDVFHGVDKEKKKVGYKMCRFAELDEALPKNFNKKSVLPRILVKLLKARKDTRKKMEYVTHTMKDGTIHYGIPTECDDGTIELFNVDLGTFKINKDDVVSSQDTYTSFEQKVLDALQLAYKVTCNSLYGQVGAGTSNICYKELAACTTATGRRMVCNARDYTLETFAGSKLTYGDTDSVFINFTDHIKQQNPGKEFTEYELLVESIQMGIKAAKNINSHMKAPQNIEYEKTLWPFVIFSKKRYFGNLYEHNPQKYKPKYMGIVLKRRDNAPVVKTIYGGVLDIILNKRNIEASKQFFIKSVEDLMQGKVNINQLVISKTLKADYANPNQIAHKVLADRMGERDPGNKPQSNDRIPYCYIDDSNLKCTICNGKVNAEKCKCITCTRMFCPNHLPKHKDVCVKTCRFCKLTEKQIKVTKCGTCLAYYCNKCNEKHMKRKDKYNKVHMDKCKKPLTHKILQGDILEHPEYITANNVKIDYRYYLDHQIWEPVKQIFALVMDKPEKLIESILRKSDNAKKGNHAITDWFKKMGMENVDEDLPSKQNKIKNDSEISEAHTEIPNVNNINIEELTTFNINNDVGNDEQNADDEDKNVLETLMGKDKLSELEELEEDEENENKYDIQDDE